MLQTEDLLSDLTDAQRSAVTHIDGPLLIIAGAGSGKTRVITRRVAYLLAQGIAPNSILAITFTNKAAGEMKTRVSSLMERPLRDFGRLDQSWPIICTFHSLGLRILKHYGERTGLPPNFSIYDTSDQERLIKEAIKLSDLSTTNFPVSVAHHEISAAKNKLQSAEGYAAAARSYPFTQWAKVFKNYDRLLRQNNALDFDDLLLRTAHALRDHPEILKELQERFQYILIDEYQDTNHAQYVIAHSMALGHGNICVVGDPDQSIYAWRGADIQNILDFEKDYPNAKVVKLEQNYRSTQTILDIASRLIARNRQRKEKKLWTENGVGGKARVFLCADEQDEARTVAEQFKTLREKGGYAWNQMAVFYRINALSRVMEDALRRAGIPYRIARGVDFYHRKEIKDVLAYLKAIANPADELSMARIVNVPARGISDNAVAKLQAHALDKGWNLWTALQSIGQIPGATPRTIKAVGTFVQLIERWRALAVADPTTISPRSDGTPRGRLTALIEDVVKTSGLEEYLSKIGEEEKQELANVDELISSAAQFDEENPQGSLEDYLGQVSLVSDVDALDDKGGAVTLMTLHAAKGLEFPVVSIIALEEGALPHARVQEHPEQLEEERRLCFVGITRAQKELILSRATYRTIRGLRERTAASRFLAEMPADLMEITDTGEGSFGDSRRLQAEQERERQSTGFRKGQRVKHPTFGVGTIQDLSNMGRDTRVVIDFVTAGRKRLILGYTRLEPV